MVRKSRIFEVLLLVSVKKQICEVVS
jgi:hypothetical protein